MSMNSAVPDIESFHRDGYLLVPGLCPEASLVKLRQVCTEHLHPLLGPAEFEADLDYPGSPESREALGGHTPRRLLNAYSRDPSFRRWATGPLVGGLLAQLFGRSDVMLSQAHHNCVMTKYPGHSSATLWHQDIRYWSYERPELISVWLALGRENSRNGVLNLIPGSHRLDIDSGRMDGARFLRSGLGENKALIKTARNFELAAGDVLFFHCRTLHAAGMNLNDQVKLSAVFTYHLSDNKPLANTRSAALPSIPVEC
jgi:phytanoyl-CoA hydroxylase